MCGNEEEEKKCPFFVKSSLMKDYCFALLYAVKKVYKENPPFCEHGNTSTLYLSRSKANFNRAFFKCANGYDPCPYFQWADEEPNKFTLSQNHPRPGYFAQKPVLAPTPTPTKYKKKRKMKLGFLPAVKRITSITFPPDEELVVPKRKKGPKEFKANKKIKKGIPSPSQITVLQEGNNQDPGTPCTSQDIQSIEQLFEATLD